MCVRKFRKNLAKYEYKKTEFFLLDFWFGLLVMSKKTLSKKTILTILLTSIIGNFMAERK